MKTFAQHSKELEEAPLIQDQIPAVKSMATKIVNLLTKENSKRRIQLMTQVARAVGIKVKVLPNGKIELR